jgi:hypothetical protein
METELLDDYHPTKTAIENFQFVAAQREAGKPGSQRAIVISSFLGLGVIILGIAFLRLARRGK